MIQVLMTSEEFISTNGDHRVHILIGNKYELKCKSTPPLF